MVSENIFSQFMYKTLANSCHVWTFKKQFCAQMALSGAGPRSAHQLRVYCLECGRSRGPYAIVTRLQNCPGPG